MKGKKNFRTEFYDARTQFLQSNIHNSLYQQWESYLPTWAEQFIPKQSTDEVLTEVREWCVRIMARETKERIFDDAVELSKQLCMENPLIKAPSLKSAKNMQMYLCQALTAVQNQLKK